MFLPAALSAATILLWATARLPEYLTALLFFSAAMVLAVAPADVIFIGFKSSAFWLILSGFVLGAAIRKVGLADRVAHQLSPHLSGSWPRMVGGTVLLTYGLAFIMPSNMGRIALLMPIVMAMADSAGLEKGSKGRIGLALAVGFGTFQLSASILPANVPNMVMAGTVETAFGLHFSYMPYLMLHAPLLGLLKGGLLALCICLLFPARPKPIAKSEQHTEATMNKNEIRLSLLLGITLLFWMTDSLHGIQPAWIGLTSACLCLLPGIGFLNTEEFSNGVNMRTCIFIAGILGLAAYVVHFGLGDLISQTVYSYLPLDPAQPFRNFVSLVGLTSALNFAVTANGVPALFTPLATSLADGSGFSLMGVLMIQVIGYATPLLPYQASPIVVAMGMENVSIRDATKLCLTLAALTYGLIVPLAYLWFNLLGWL